MIGSNTEWEVIKKRISEDALPAVVSARRGGNTAIFDAMNKYFTISGMPVASSTYWNQVHGFKPNAMNNLQLQLLNNSNGGSDWKEHLK